MEDVQNSESLQFLYLGVEGGQRLQKSRVVVVDSSGWWGAFGSCFKLLDAVEVRPNHRLNRLGVIVVCFSFLTHLRIIHDLEGPRGASSGLGVLGTCGIQWDGGVAGEGRLWVSLVSLSKASWRGMVLTLPGKSSP